ncbi:CD209 antigen-like protein A isoform X1 [Oreochromis niloticus]|uniref:CD209 antigen-like protein A isoform X1 n=1 Tax=Oreochromis niloticus TaxID=8128 RepID=UPI00039432C5|nr:CD209 antigen-like protein A isoform X1 [Oreochromis niloticus]
MKEININEDDFKRANRSSIKNPTGPRSYKRGFYVLVILSLGLLAGIITLALYYKTCPAGWSMFSHSCYLLSGRSGSWHSARKNCIDQGADLVVIDSPEEQNFIASFTEERTWIGLNDIEQEGTWKWVDGTPLTLQYWASGQPDNHHLREDCVHIRDPGTSWNDERCDDSYQWVCEKVL